MSLLLLLYGTGQASAPSPPAPPGPAFNAAGGVPVPFKIRKKRVRAAERSLRLLMEDEQMLMIDSMFE